MGVHRNNEETKISFGVYRKEIKKQNVKFNGTYFRWNIVFRQTYSEDPQWVYTGETSENKMKLKKKTSVKKDRSYKKNQYNDRVNECTKKNY